MSIDLYPALDRGATDVAVALERVPPAGAVAPIGAASLLYRNDDQEWPEAAGEDLVSRYPDLHFLNLAMDGATIGDVFGEQLTRLDPSDEPTLMTLTVGGNDLLSAVSNRPRPELLRRIVRGITEAYDELVRTLLEVRPVGELVVTTVYDPSDTTGRVPGILEEIGVLPLEYLHSVNAHIRALAAGTDRVLLADAYAHFLGHGVSAPAGGCWYWSRSMIEPGATGAHELRRLWLEVVEAYALE
jgi:lysophospholipase L1-like esterase